MDNRCKLIVTFAFVVSVVAIFSLTRHERIRVSSQGRSSSFTPPRTEDRIDPRATNEENAAKKRDLPPLFEQVDRAILSSKIKRAELAMQDTPEKHQAAIDAMLEHRRPHVDALFETWNLPPDKKASVYEVIRTRLEKRRIDSVNRSLGFATGSTDRDSSRNEIDVQAAQDLKRIVGEKRSLELINLDARLEGEIRQKLMDAGGSSKRP